MNNAKKRISKSDVEYTAKLSRIKLDESEIEKFQSQFEGILGFIDQLSEVETGGILPTAQVTNLKNVLRKDEVKPSLKQEYITTEPSGYFIVPKVLE